MSTSANASISNFSGIDLARLPSIAKGEIVVVRARSVRATEATLAGYGHFIDDFAHAEVTIVPWPVKGPRPLVAGTGIEGGTVEDRFLMERRGQVQYAVNKAVGRTYLTGWFDDPASAREDVAPRDASRIYTHEANYHPDGGQIFAPITKAPFVALLARPGDDVKAEDFVAFWFDGTRGVHVDPGVWHQPAFPVPEHATFDNRQGKIHACVSIDFVGELRAYIEVPLTEPRA